MERVELNSPTTEPAGQLAGRCYEVHTTEPHKLPVAAFSLACELDPVRQLAQHPGGLIPLDWAADPHQPAALALPPPSANGAPTASLSSPRGLLQVEGGEMGALQTHTSPEPPPLPWGAEPRRSADSPLVRSQGDAVPRFAVSMSGDAIKPSRAGADESQPRPSPRGLRPYGSPVLGGSSGIGLHDSGSPGRSFAPVMSPWGRGAVPAGLHRVQRYGAMEEESEDGGGRSESVQIGSPERAVEAGAGAARAPAAALGQVDAVLGVPPSSPSLPALLGGPYASSPSRGRAGKLERDVLRDSLDTGRRAVSAAAAAIANAEAAVMRSSSRTPVVAAAAPPLDPLRESLRQSAQAVGGLAAALNAAATALNEPPSTSARGQPAAPGAFNAAAPSSSWSYTAQQPNTCAGALGPLYAPVASSGQRSEVPPCGTAAPVGTAGCWGGDEAARGLQLEVLRLRTEVRPSALCALRGAGILHQGQHTIGLQNTSRCPTLPTKQPTPTPDPLEPSHLPAAAARSIAAAAAGRNRTAAFQGRSKHVQLWWSLHGGCSTAGAAAAAAQAAA